MKPDEIRRLLGGYATGTLTDGERDLLLTAALEDQSLFDALADEEALRELLADPLVRGELLSDLEKPAGNEARSWERPMHDGYAASSAAPVPRVAKAAQPLSNEAPSSKSSRSVWATFVAALTPRRMAVAGAFAALIVVIGGVQYMRQSNAARPVELAMNKNPITAQQDRSPATPLPESVEKDAKRSTAAATRGATGGSGPVGAETRERVTPEARRDSGSAPKLAFAPAAPVAATAPTAAEPPPARQVAPAPFLERDQQLADERREAELSAAQLARAVGGATKDTEAKSEQAAGAAPGAAQPAAVRSAPALASAPPPPTPPAAKARLSANQATTNQVAGEQAKPAQASGIAAGIAGFRTDASPADRLRQMNAHVTDINGTIVSISAGANAGLKSGDTLEIVRAGRAIGTVRLSEAGEAFAVGPFSPAPGGAGLPRAGDLVQPARPAKP